MRVLLVGGTGLLGKAVHTALARRPYDVLLRGAQNKLLGQVNSSGRASPTSRRRARSP